MYENSGQRLVGMLARASGRGSHAGKEILGEQGATLVETAVALTVYLCLFFGLVWFSMALYTFNFVSDAAREATRWAAVRGANSCFISSSFPSCNLLPTNITSNTDPANNPVLAQIESLGYPALSAGNVSASVTWWEPTVDANGHTTWTTPCTGAKDGNGTPCNAVGNAVKVVATYNFPLGIPFWNRGNVTLNSTSQMVINE
jgi:hypothetical protein